MEGMKSLTIVMSTLRLGWDDSSKDRIKIPMYYCFFSRVRGVVLLMAAT